MPEGAGGWLCSVLGLVVVWLAVAGVLLCLGGVASASLPDGRAWEMVSPLAKNGGDIRGIERGISEGGVVQASADGQRITYASLASFAEPRGAPVGSQYVSDRAAGGWLTQNISTPLNAQTYKPAGTEGTPFDAFSVDLSSGLVFGGDRAANEAGVLLPVPGPPLAPGAPAGYEDYYVDQIPGGALRSVLARAPGVPPQAFNLTFLGGTPDLSHVVVESSEALGAGVINETGEYRHLYEWEAATGQFQLVSVLPNGTADTTNNVHLGGGETAGQAVSEDGSRVIWTGGKGLFVREGIGTAQVRTVQADAPGIGKHGAVFLTANSDASKVFFADAERLTTDSTAGPSEDLYMFEPGAGEAGRLVDLTVDHVDVGGAEVQGVLGASADGSYVYFVANGVLGDAAAHGATRGSCSSGSSSGSSSVGGVCNLYLWHEGWEKPKFIATLSSEDENRGRSALNAFGVAKDWDFNFTFRTARVSRDGLRVVFMSKKSLTGYDNTVSSGSGCGGSESEGFSVQCEEVFLYEASSVEGASGRLSCVSCNPSGARPVGPSGIPGATSFSHVKALYQSRVLSEGGVADRVFFESADVLVGGDSNGVRDVYEYEGGRVYLLSDGVSPGGASFVDASVNGNDVFFITRAQLAGQDTDQLVDLYDARAPHEPGESVGFPVPSLGVVCKGEGCRSSGGVPPVFGVPASAAFVGPGNPDISSSTVKHKQKHKAKKRAKKRGRRRARVRRGRARARGRAGAGSVVRGRGGQ